MSRQIDNSGSDAEEENLCQKRRIMATPPLVKYFSQEESSSNSDNEEGSGRFKMPECDHDDVEDYDEFSPKLNIGNGNGIGVVEQKRKKGHKNTVSKEQKPVNF
jgi:hypothetical protein